DGKKHGRRAGAPASAASGLFDLAPAGDGTAGRTISRLHGAGVPIRSERRNRSAERADRLGRRGGADDPAPPVDARFHRRGVPEGGAYFRSRLRLSSPLFDPPPLFRSLFYRDVRGGPEGP